MSVLALEIDQALKQLDSANASRLEQLVREALALVKQETAPIVDASVNYELPEHSFGLREDVDPTKLGQLAEDL